MVLLVVVVITAGVLLGDPGDLVEDAPLLLEVLTLERVLGVGVRGAGAAAELVGDVLGVVDRGPEDAVQRRLEIEDVVKAPASRTREQINFGRDPRACDSAPC